MANARRHMAAARLQMATVTRSSGGRWPHLCGRVGGSIDHRVAADQRWDAVRGQVTILGGRPIVIDGDTVRWQGRTVRLVGFDAPETGDRARCASERDRGDRATTRLRELITSGNVTVELVRCACPPAKVGTEACNFGRACGILTVNGRDAGDRLIAEGLARPYHCGQFSCPSRGSWC